MIGNAGLVASDAAHDRPKNTGHVSTVCHNSVYEAPPLQHESLVQSYAAQGIHPSRAHLIGRVRVSESSPLHTNVATNAVYGMSRESERNSISTPSVRQQTQHDKSVGTQTAGGIHPSRAHLVGKLPTREDPERSSSNPSARSPATHEGGIHSTQPQRRTAPNQITSETDALSAQGIHPSRAHLFGGKPRTAAETSDYRQNMDRESMPSTAQPSVDTGEPDEMPILNTHPTLKHRTRWQDPARRTRWQEPAKKTANRPIGTGGNADYTGLSMPGAISSGGRNGQSTRKIGTGGNADLGPGPPEEGYSLRSGKGTKGNQTSTNKSHNNKRNRGRKSKKFRKERKAEKNFFIGLERKKQSLQIPPDYVLTKPGDAMVTRRLKQGPHVYVEQTKSKNGRNIMTELAGVWAPPDAVTKVMESVKQTRDNPQYHAALDRGKVNRQKKEQELSLQLQATVIEFLNFRPSHASLAQQLAERVVTHAIPVGSNTVLRKRSTKNLDEPKRARLATMAWLRHSKTCVYDQTRFTGSHQRRLGKSQAHNQNMQILRRYRTLDVIDPATCPLVRAVAESENQTVAKRKSKCNTSIHEARIRESRNRVGLFGAKPKSTETRTQNLIRKTVQLKLHMQKLRVEKKCPAPETKDGSEYAKISRVMDDIAATVKKDPSVEAQWIEEETAQTELGDSQPDGEELTLEKRAQKLIDKTLELKMHMQTLESENKFPKPDTEAGIDYANSSNTLRSIENAIKQHYAIETQWVQEQSSFAQKGNLRQKAREAKLEQVPNSRSSARRRTPTSSTKTKHGYSTADGFIEISDSDTGDSDSSDGSSSDDYWSVHDESDAESSGQEERDHGIDYESASDDNHSEMAAVSDYEAPSSGPEECQSATEQVVRRTRVDKPYRPAPKRKPQNESNIHGGGDGNWQFESEDDSGTDSDWQPDDTQGSSRSKQAGNHTSKGSGKGKDKLLEAIKILETELADTKTGKMMKAIFREVEKKGKSSTSGSADALSLHEGHGYERGASRKRVKYTRGRNRTDSVSGEDDGFSRFVAALESDRKRRELQRHADGDEIVDTRKRKPNDGGASKRLKVRKTKVSECIDLCSSEDDAVASDDYCEKDMSLETTEEEEEDHSERQRRGSHSPPLNLNLRQDTVPPGRRRRIIDSDDESDQDTSRGDTVEKQILEDEDMNSPDPSEAEDTPPPALIMKNAPKRMSEPNRVAANGLVSQLNLSPDDLDLSISDPSAAGVGNLHTKSSLSDAKRTESSPEVPTSKIDTHIKLEAVCKLSSPKSDSSSKSRNCFATEASKLPPGLKCTALKTEREDLRGVKPQNNQSESKGLRAGPLSWTAAGGEPVPTARIKTEGVKRPRIISALPLPPGMPSKVVQATSSPTTGLTKPRIIGSGLNFVPRMGNIVSNVTPSPTLFRKSVPSETSSGLEVAQSSSGSLPLTRAIGHTNPMSTDKSASRSLSDVGKIKDEGVSGPRIISSITTQKRTKVEQVTPTPVGGLFTPNIIWKARKFVPNIAPEFSAALSRPSAVGVASPTPLPTETVPSETSQSLEIVRSSTRSAQLGTIEMQSEPKAKSGETANTVQSTGSKTQRQDTESQPQKFVCIESDSDEDCIVLD